MNGEPGLALALTVAGILITGACASAPAGKDVPAVITSPTEAGRAELLRVVRGALNGAPLTLADDALTRDSSLIVERVRPRDASGLPLDGRVLGAPDRFRLVVNGSRCLLVHERTGKRYRLRATTCAARPGGR